MSITWNIGRAGRAWTGDEAMQRWELIPEKFELLEVLGKVSMAAPTY